MGAKQAENDLNERHREVLQLFRDADEPVLTASDIGEHIDVTRAAINNWLDELVDRGELQRKKAGGAAVVYWIPAAHSASAASDLPEGVSQ